MNVKKFFEDGRFNVGDRVKIISVKRCKFGYNNIMTDCIGQTTVIIGKKLSYDEITWEYKVRADKGNFTWSDNCFKLIEEKIVMKNE